MPYIQEKWQQVISFVQDRQTTLTSGLAALLIIVVGFLIFNFFLNVNKETSPQQTTNEATDSAQLSPSTTPAPPQDTKGSLTAQVSPEGGASITQAQEYTVVRGDTLGKIAQKFYNDASKWSLIAQTNKLSNPSLIHAGNKLTIPKSETGVAAATTVIPATKVSAGNVEYVVTQGDTLWQIAIDFYGTGFDWFKIRDANKETVGTLPNGRPLIKSGQHLVIP